MHEMISSRGVVWLGVCIGCGFALLATHLIMKIRMVAQALPGAWLLKDDRLTPRIYRDQAKSRGWSMLPVWIYEALTSVLLLSLAMIIVNELLLKTPHYPEAQFQQVYLRWRAGRAKLTAKPADALPAAGTSADKPNAAGADEKATTPAGTSNGKIPHGEGH